MAEQRPVVLVGGGTGGHIYPLVAVGEELLSRKIPFVFIGSRNSQEEKVIGDLKWKFYTVSAGKWRRYFTFSSFFLNIWDIMRNILGFFQALSILARIKPKAVFCKGGYVALPVVLAARFWGIKVVIHESDSVMGLTNRLASRFADRVLTMFQVDTYPNKDDRFAQVGIPIRKGLRQAAKLKAPQKTRPIILVLPGSQGSTKINSLVGEVLEPLLNKVDLVHMTGEADFAKYKQAREQLPEQLRSHYKVYSFIDRELPYYYQTADALICRASATTLAEAALFGKALYLIPLPTSASDHQAKNAQVLAKNKAAIVRRESELIGEKVLSDMMDLINNPAEMKRLGDNLKNYLNEDQSLDLIVRELE